METMGLKNETKSFYREYVSGMNSQQLGKEFHADSDRLKKLYRDAIHEANPDEPADNIPAFQKFLSVLTALTKRLNPVRRLVFGVAVLTFAIYLVFSVLGIGFFIYHPILLPLSFLAILVILMIELLEKSDVQQELNFARDIQLSLLPPSSVKRDNLESYSFAATAQEVGGDYIDVINTEKGTYVIIADVSGKGMSAALYMVRIQALVHLLINKQHPSPKELFLELNDYVKSNKSDKTFVTSCVAYFPKNENHFLFARAGHNQPIFFSREMDATFQLKTDGMALGMTSTDILSKNMREKKFRFEQGDSVLFYTDGLTEARNSSGEEYGIDRLDGLLSIYGSLHAKTISQKIQSSIDSFLGDEKPIDDITFTTVHKVEPPKKIT